MFNEAFWFFYAISVVEDLAILFTILSAGSIMGIIASFIAAGDYTMGKEGTKEALKFAKRFAISAVIFIPLAIAVPSKESFYAGAGQYVAESAELDETLMQLKKAIDKKVEKLNRE